MRTTIDSELSQVAAVADAEVRAELEKSVAHSWIEHNLGWLAGHNWGARTADLLRVVWKTYVYPDWPRRRAMRERDVIHRVRADDSATRYVHVSATCHRAPLRGQVTAVLNAEGHHAFWSALLTEDDLTPGQAQLLPLSTLIAAWSTTTPQPGDHTRPTTPTTPVAPTTQNSRDAR